MALQPKPTLEYDPLAIARLVRDAGREREAPQRPEPKKERPRGVTMTQILLKESYE